MNIKLNPVKIPELLAPAGNLESAITAFESGADAVYAGLGKFNAREMGDNFSNDDLSRLKAYTVNHGKKFYLTFNTLIKENELEEFGSIISSASEFEPDAVIVQDIGAVALIRDNFPSIDIHASTQMAIHNSPGIIEAAEMGIKRVILERQLSLEEIELIMKKSPIEVEVFIHGALCCSLSGQCLLSSWLGGYSGNRGKCKQPCRRIYQEKGKKGFLLSPGDLSTTDLIEFFIKSGVSSLKIEGRLKRGDYIKNTVSAYRKILDYYRDHGEINKQVIDEGNKSLSRTHTRTLTHGFYVPVEIPGLIKPEKTGLSGKHIGDVTKTGKGFFEITLKEKLHIGDKIRINNKFKEEKNIVTVTALLLKDKKVKGAKRGNTVRLSTGKRIPLHGIVYKTGESVTSVSINKNTLPFYKKKLEIDLSIKISEHGFIINSHSSGKEGYWEYNSDFDEAEKNPVTIEDLIKQFRGTGSENLSVGNIDAETGEKYFIPASIQKKIKKEFWIWAAEYYIEELNSLKTKIFFKENILNKYRIIKDSEKNSEKIDTPLISTVLISEKTPEKEIKFQIEKKKNIIFSCSIDYFLKNKSADTPVIKEIILPHFCSEKDLEKLNIEIDECYKKGIRRFRLSSIYQLSMLEKYSDIEKTVSYPFPVTNSVSSWYLKIRAVKKAQGWIELDKESFNLFAENSTIETEIYSYGLPFIFATRAMIRSDKKITDERGKAFYTDRDKGITYLYPDANVNLESPVKTASFYDFSHNISEIEDKNSDFNFSKTFQ